MTNDCVFSSDRAYRYSLLHTITTPAQGHPKIIAWIGLNPSTAGSPEDEAERIATGCKGNVRAAELDATTWFDFRAQ